MIGYNAVVYPLAVALFVLGCGARVAVLERACRNGVAIRRRGGGGPAASLAAARLDCGADGLGLVSWRRSVSAGHSFGSGATAGRHLRSFLRLVLHVRLDRAGLFAVRREFIVLRVLYPGMWRNTRGFTAVAQGELDPVPKQLDRIQLLAGSIPLLAAILMLILGNTADGAFRLLVTGLIVLGMVGFLGTSAWSGSCRKWSSH